MRGYLEVRPNVLVGQNVKVIVDADESGGPGSTTELVSITLKRAAFEKWETGYASALAVILFVTIFGAANIYVKALNKVKQQ